MKPLTTAENVMTWACVGRPNWWEAVTRVTKIDHEATVRECAEVRRFRDGSAIKVRSHWKSHDGSLGGVTCEVYAGGAA